jgi:flagellar hook-basal body complex protein FliE
MNVGLDPSALGNLYQQVSKSQNKPNPAEFLGQQAKAGDLFGASLRDQVAQVDKSGQVPGLGSLINAVDSKQKAAMESQRAFLAGESNNLHQTMIAGQEASLAFSLMVEMRNKVMEAYQELMRLQV